VLNQSGALSIVSAVDDVEGVSQGRGRRAAGLIAIGLALVLVGGIVYLRPFAQPAAPAPAATTLAGHFVVPSDMQWFSADEGWLVFSEGPNHSALFHTRDAGRHWQNNFTAPLGNANAVGLKFFDARRGVLRIWGDALGARALATKDGGRSWQPLHLPSLGGYYVNVEFSDPEHAWVAWVTQASPASVPTVDLYRTADGGQNWQKFPNGALNGLPQPASGSPLFASAQDGWVQVGSQLYASHDGGDSWQPESLELPPAGSVSLGQAIVSPGGLVTLTFEGSSGQVPRGVEMWVAASSDGGRTWQPLVHTPETPSPNAGAGPDWQPPHFSDARNGWLVVGQIMYTTADSGRTWNRKAMPAGAECADVTPVIASTAWCAAHYPLGVRLFRTVDGGRHWSGVAPPI